jgi:hypothetical protein
MFLEFRCFSGGMHPVRGAIWYRMPRSSGGSSDRYDRYLCAALFMTMHSPAECELALKLLNLVQSGKSTEEQFGINDTCVTFRSSGVQVDILIEDEVGTPEGRFDLEEFRKAVTGWKEFLLMPESSESKLRVKLA